MAMAAVAFEAHGLVQGMQQSCVAQKSSFLGSPIPSSSSSSPSSISCKLLRKTVARESSGFGAVVLKVARSGGVRCEAQAIERNAAVKPETGPKRDVDAFSGLSQVCAVLGTQWGDEGKGKLVDILAQRFDIVARCQVGASLSFFLFFTCCGEILEPQPCSSSWSTEPRVYGRRRAWLFAIPTTFTHCCHCFFISIQFVHL